MHIVFKTPRLTLRRFTEADAPLIFALNSDPEVLKYVHERLLTDEEDARRVITDIILPQYNNDLGRWAIHVNDTNEFIGWCGLKYLPEVAEIDLGYRLFKNQWGKGYATEAAKATLDHGFNELKLGVITGKAHIENKASLHVLEKIGMRYVKDEIVDDCQVKTYELSRRNKN
jgi:RimJ/RimL family protein N-acetyltransferase